MLFPAKLGALLPDSQNSEKYYTPCKKSLHDSASKFQAATMGFDERVCAPARAELGQILYLLAVIRVYDESGNVIETHEHAGDFKEW